MDNDITTDTDTTTTDTTTTDTTGTTGTETTTTTGTSEQGVTTTTETTGTTTTDEPPSGSTTTATPPGNADGLMFGDNPLPDFVPPTETPRERELRQQLEALQRGQAEKPKPLTAEPQKPEAAQFGTDEEYEAALEAYFGDKARWKEQQVAHTRQVEQQQKQFNEALDHYKKGRDASVTQFKDFAAVEQYADDNLDPGVVATIIFGAKEGHYPNPQNMIYAIGRNPELMKKLNESTNPILTCAILADISQKSQFAPKEPKQPINQIPPVHGGGITDLQAQLEAAEKEADETGDRTKVHRIRAQMAEAEAKK